MRCDLLVGTGGDEVFWFFFGLRSTPEGMPPDISRVTTANLYQICFMIQFYGDVVEY